MRDLWHDAVRRVARRQAAGCYDGTDLLQAARDRLRNFVFEHMPDPTSHTGLSLAQLRSLANRPDPNAFGVQHPLYSTPPDAMDFELFGE